MTLVDAGGAISGTATVIGAVNNCVGDSFEVSGTRRGSAVDLTFSCPNYTPFTFEGDLTRDGISIQGTLNGSGFHNTTLNLAKTT
jgi:hypothetical protein